MYNSRTKSTLCPAPLPEDHSIPLLPFNGCSKKKQDEFDLLVPAEYANIPAPFRSGNFVHFASLIHFNPYTSFHFHLLHTPQHRTA